MNENDEAGFRPVTAEIVLLTEGSIQLHCNTTVIKLEKGHPAAIIFPGEDVKLIAASNVVLYRATVPVNIGE